MSDNDTEAVFQDGRIQALCPHCDRKEPFADESTGRAWLTGHIKKEHSDKLPDFGGVQG